MLYQHMAIISCYFVTVFLKYVHNCKRQFHNTYILSYRANKKKVMCHIIKIVYSARSTVVMPAIAAYLLPKWEGSCPRTQARTRPQDMPGYNIYVTKGFYIIEYITVRSTLDKRIIICYAQFFICHLRSYHPPNLSFDIPITTVAWIQPDSNSGPSS